MFVSILFKRILMAFLQHSFRVLVCIAVQDLVGILHDMHLLIVLDSPVACLHRIKKISNLSICA